MSEGQKKLVIVGTGPQAQIAKDYFEEHTNYEVLGFACHNEFKESDEIYSMPLVAIEDLLEKHSPDDTEAFVAIGYKSMNKMRQSVYEEIKSLGFRLASFIHPRATISATAEFGDNGALSGGKCEYEYQPINIGDNCFIGTNTVITKGVNIGKHCLIGANAVVTKSFLDNKIIMGVPAKCVGDVIIQNNNVTLKYRK